MNKYYYDNIRNIPFKLEKWDINYNEQLAIDDLQEKLQSYCRMERFNATMSSLRQFKATDLFNFNAINLDSLTETYNISFYLSYLARWPDLFSVQCTPSSTLMAYVMGKAEGQGTDWHGHVTAITVAPEYRRLGLAQGMMALLEQVSEYPYDGYFVDLFVRRSNKVAIEMYTQLGYSIYRTVREYYSGETSEDAFDMRKPLKRDVDRKSVRENGESFIVEPHEVVF
ncbi:N-terminal acetyltransferase [Haplosporangium sp. Z 11]|nr:N-terminal acetyltransferase [Haplosporangium sp. Z 11]